MTLTVKFLDGYIKNVFFRRHKERVFFMTDDGHSENEKSGLYRFKILKSRYILKIGC